MASRLLKRVMGGKEEENTGEGTEDEAQSHDSEPWLKDAPAAGGPDAAGRDAAANAENGSTSEKESAVNPDGAAKGAGSAEIALVALKLRYQSDELGSALREYPLQHAIGHPRQNTHTTKDARTPPTSGAGTSNAGGGNAAVGLMAFHEQLKARASALREREQSLDSGFEQSLQAALQLRERIIAQREVRDTGYSARTGRW